MKIKSVTDVITNSSTEVFIVKKSDIDKKDINEFDTYKSVDDVYEEAKRYDEGKNTKGIYELCQVVHDIIIYKNDDYEYSFSIEPLLEEWGKGGLAEELKMSLADILRFLEPLWKDKITEYGYARYNDDCGPYPFKEWYKPVGRR